MTKDYLVFHQPFIHEGALLSSSASGRRLYIHHLSEVPLSEVFTTRVGNHLQRVDKVTSTSRASTHSLQRRTESNSVALLAQGKVMLAGIELEVTAPPDGMTVPTSKMLFQLPAAAFTGSVQGRDKMVRSTPKGTPRAAFGFSGRVLRSSHAFGRRLAHR